MEEEKMSGLGKGSGGRPAGKVLQDEEKVVMPGFRFHPTDEELVGFYLKRKVEKKLFSIDVIKQIDIYKYNPWDLPVASTVGEMEWYFFCLRGRKYRNSIRPNRVTGSGFWKATGIDRPIYSADESGECIGLKKSLVYYRGSAGKGTKTDWMMHEFRLPSNAKNSETISPSMQEAEIWTICRIFKRNLCHKKYTRQDWKGSSSKQTPADTESKTSSFESDNGDDHKCYGASYIQQGENIVTNYFVEKNQPYASQWNPMVQAPLSTLFPNIPSATTNEFVKDENWDELGRITGFMNDQAMSDPAYVYDCRYTQEEYSKVAEEDHLDSMRMIHRRYQISIGHVLNLIAWLITLGPCRSGYLSARCGAIMHEGIDVTHYFL